MAEIQHPPIDIGSIMPLSPERDIAEQAYEMLQHYGIMTYAQVDDAEVMYATTPAADLISAEDESDMVQLRLAGVPTMEWTTADVHGIDHEGISPSCAYEVMNFQYGRPQLDEAKEGVLGYSGRIAWEEYVTIIVNAADTDDITVVEKRTGRSLESGELMQVKYLLSLMQNELRGIGFEEIDVPEEDMTHQEPFDPEEGVRSYHCTTCQQSNLPCVHNPFTLN